jgi:hypothetical protein
VCKERLALRNVAERELEFSWGSVRIRHHSGQAGDQLAIWHVGKSRVEARDFAQVPKWIRSPRPYPCRMRTEIVLLARDEGWANTATVCPSRRAEAAITDHDIVQNFDSDEIASPRSATDVVLDRSHSLAALPW